MEWVELTQEQIFMENLTAMVVALEAMPAKNQIGILDSIDEYISARRKALGDA